MKEAESVCKRERERAREDEKGEGRVLRQLATPCHRLYKDAGSVQMNQIQEKAIPACHTYPGKCLIRVVFVDFFFAVSFNRESPLLQVLPTRSGRFYPPNTWLPCPSVVFILQSTKKEEKRRRKLKITKEREDRSGVDHPTPFPCSPFSQADDGPPPLRSRVLELSTIAMSIL